MRADPPSIRVHCSKCGYTVSREVAIACTTNYCPPRSHFRKLGGFIAIPPLPLWAYLTIALGIAIAFGAFQTHRIKGYKNELAAIKALGAEQERQSKLQAERDRKEKERADNDAKRRFADLNSRYKRLLDGPGVLPPAAPGAGSGERICFARDALSRALSEFVGGAAGLLAEGDRGIVAADIARQWATAPSPAP